MLSLKTVDNSEHFSLFLYPNLYKEQKERQKYGLEIDFKTFMNILNVPNSSIADLVNHSQNLILHSDDEYSVAKFAKTHNLVYGYVFNPTTNNLFYYVVNRTYPFQFDRGVFIDPNNPF